MPHRPHSNVEPAQGRSTPQKPCPDKALDQLLLPGQGPRARACLTADPKARLYLGLGLAGRALSEGLPLDVLALVALTETLRRKSQSKIATILIADTNAVAAGYPDVLVQEVAKSYLDQVRALCQFLNAPIEVTLASQWTLLANPVNLPRAAMKTAPYVRVQLEQMKALFAHGYRIKVGWRMPGAKRDEGHFDELYREHLEDQQSPHRLQTVYGLAGRTFSDSHPRACPYVAYAGQQRLLISDQASVRTQVSQGLLASPNATRGYRRHLLRIARGLRPLLDAQDRNTPSLALLERVRQAAQGPTCK